MESEFIKILFTGNFITKLMATLNMRNHRTVPHLPPFHMATHTKNTKFLYIIQYFLSVLKKYLQNLFLMEYSKCME